jgi:hypothetical protein
MCLFAPCVLFVEETSFSRDVMTVLKGRLQRQGMLPREPERQGGIQGCRFGGESRGRISRNCDPAGE